MTGDVPVTGAERAICPECGSRTVPDARFCEACGVPLQVPAAVPGGAASPGGAAGPAAPACRECGAPVDADGYCTECGAKAPSPRDHVTEQPQPWVAGVSDRGARRTRNEDALALAAGERPGGFAALVVCDGVSSAPASDVASLAAARAARDVLVPVAGAGTATPATRIVSATGAATRAVAAATPADPGESAPSCTFVAVLLEDGRVSVGAVGDSRAYWLPDAGEPRQLTVDDSLAAELVAAGASREEAEAGVFAHTITRWLGVDSPDAAPRISGLVADRPGWLLACTDGLWNYCSPAPDLAELVHATAAAAGPDPLATAGALVEWAIGRGGHDNITVALARLGEPAADAGAGRPAVGEPAAGDDEPPRVTTRGESGP